MLTVAKKLVQSTLAPFGYRLARVVTSIPSTPAYGLDCIFPLLTRFGFAPKHILDVGANIGNWTRTAVKYFPNALYTLVEPQDELKVCIQDLIAGGYKIQWVHAGAAEKPGLLPFTINTQDYGSSTFAMGEEDARAQGLRRVPVQVRTLDEIVLSANLPIPDIVKVDAEGFDLRVLSGASGLIGRTEIFFVEAAVCAPIENSVLQVVKWMSESGYSLLDLTDINRSPRFGVLWLLELAFLRKASSLFDSVTSYV